MTVILGVFGTILGYAVSFVIVSLIAKFVFDFCLRCIEVVWEAVHEPSLKKFKAKMAERKANKKVKK